MDLNGSKTFQNLKDAFAGESMANRRYLYFARQADVEGQPDIAGLFRDTAEGETGHAHGHLDYLRKVGDPATGLPIGETQLNLKADPSSSNTSPPRVEWAIKATRLPIVPDGTNIAASLAVRSAARASSLLTVGSPSRESSPSGADRMASSISGVGWVTVSLRRSMIVCMI